MQIFRERDANMLHLQNCKVAVLGFGNMGRAVAMNLRDSNIPVVIGNIADAYATDAERNGFEVSDIPNATLAANIIYMTMPDETMPKTYLRDVAPYLSMNDLIVFASGYNIAYQFIEPPVFVDVGLLAPRTLAANVRDAYEKGVGYPSFIALHQAATSTAQDRLLALAMSVGALRQGAIEMAFGDEVALDLFWQQAILPALHALLITATQILVKEGYPPEAVLTELYLSGEMGNFFNQAAREGMIPTLNGMSLTGLYGVLSRTERFQETKTRFHMESILDNIRNGEFAREWSAEYADGYPRLAHIRDKLAETMLWQSEQATMQTIKEE